MSFEGGAQFLHTLRQDKALHDLVHSVVGYQSDQYIVDELQRLACDTPVVESEILEIWETTQVQSGPEWEPHFAQKYRFKVRAAACSACVSKCPHLSK